jgi:hypothetical protein
VVRGITADIYQFTSVIIGDLSYNSSTHVSSADATFSSVAFGERQNFIGSFLVRTASVPGPIVATPLPAAFPLFASGLGAMALLSWRRRKNAVLQTEQNTGSDLERPPRGGLSFALLVAIGIACSMRCND